VIVVVLVVVIATRPSEFRVQRTATMSAPAPVVFGQVNDFHKWEAWSPYATRDPAMKKTIEGAPAGVGAIYTWSGNHEVGEGRTTIIESRPSELIRIKLEFVRPFAGTSTAEFTFKPEDERTAVTWSLHGRNNFTAKAMGHEHGQDDRRRFRERAGADEVGGRSGTPAIGGDHGSKE
jgi:carbon monoxide dehydrogenase subunit G